MVTGVEVSLRYIIPTSRKITPKSVYGVESKQKKKQEQRLAAPVYLVCLRGI